MSTYYLNLQLLLHGRVSVADEHMASLRKCTVYLAKGRPDIIAELGYRVTLLSSRLV